VAPQREVISSLLRRDLPVLRPEMLPYFQDVHDHIIRVTEEIDAMRELLSALLDAQVSHSANRLNHTMRTMTAWSIILMSMALIASIYGMNFDWMPELHWRAGYFMSLLLMAGIGIGLLAFFRRNRWL
jgi:magnesium transporter